MWLLFFDFREPHWVLQEFIKARNLDDFGLLPVLANRLSNHWAQQAHAVICIHVCMSGKTVESNCC